MIDDVTLEGWCALVEDALIADTAEAWERADAAELPEVLRSSDFARQATASARLDDLLAHVEARRAEVAGELAAISEERRQLAARSRGITSYYSAESLH